MPVMEAMRAQGLEQLASYVVVEPELEQHVISLVSRLPRKLQVNFLRSQIIMLAPPVSRTFVEMPGASAS